MRKLIVLAIVFTSCLPLLAQYSGYSRQHGYYFRPSRTILNFRPDYVFQPYSSGYGYGYGYGYREYGYGYREYHCYGDSYLYGPGATWYPGLWSQGGRGTYSTYLMSPAGIEVVRSNSSDLVFKVTPERALVYVDGKLIGNAGSFSTERDRYMVLDGRHELRVEYPGYKPFDTELDVQANRTIHLDIELTKLATR